MPVQSPAAPAGAPSFAFGGGGGLPGGALPVFDGPNQPWTYAINPAALDVRYGRIVPRPAKVWHEPGYGANMPGDSEPGQGYYMNLRASAPGFVLIPHDRDLVAFGATRTGKVHGPPTGSTYMVAHRGRTQGGAEVWHWTDAWRRPVAQGFGLAWQYDHDGRDAFLVSCLDLITPPGGLTPEQVAAAIGPTVAHCRYMQEREDARGRRELMTSLRHLPAEYVPADLAEDYRRAMGDGPAAPPAAEESEAPTPARKRPARAPTSD